VAVVAIPDDKWIERPLAVVVPKPNENITRENLNQHLQQFVDSEKIKSFAIPKEYCFVAQLPRTSAGKIDKKKIRASISQNRDIKLIL
jgi:fatty-acyl-CoA synthase